MTYKRLYKKINCNSNSNRLSIYNYIFKLVLFLHLKEESFFSIEDIIDYLICHEESFVLIGKRLSGKSALLDRVLNEDYLVKKKIVGDVVELDYQHIFHNKKKRKFVYVVNYSNNEVNNDNFKINQDIFENIHTENTLLNKENKNCITVEKNVIDDSGGFCKMKDKNLVFFKQKIFNQKLPKTVNCENFINKYNLYEIHMETTRSYKKELFLKAYKLIKKTYERERNTKLQFITKGKALITDFINQITNSLIDLEEKSKEIELLIKNNNAQIINIEKEKTKINTELSKINEKKENIEKKINISKEKSICINERMKDAILRQENSSKDVNAIPKNHLTEIRAMKNPPNIVRIVVELIYCIVRKKEADKKSFSSFIKDNFVGSILNYKLDNDTCTKIDLETSKFNRKNLEDTQECDISIEDIRQSKNETRDMKACNMPLEDGESFNIFVENYKSSDVSIQDNKSHNVSIEDINEKEDFVIEKLKNNFSNPEFTYEKANRASKACGPLFKWIESIYQLLLIQKETKPLRDELKIHSESIIIETKTLNKKSEELKDLEFKLQTKEKEYIETQNIISKYENDISVIKKRINESSNVITVLEKEIEKWCELVAEADIFSVAFFYLFGNLDRINEYKVYTISRLIEDYYCTNKYDKIKNLMHSKNCKLPIDSEYASKNRNIGTSFEITGNLTDHNNKIVIENINNGNINIDIKEHEIIKNENGTSLDENFDLEQDNIPENWNIEKIASIYNFNAIPQADLYFIDDILTENIKSSLKYSTNLTENERISFFEYINVPVYIKSSNTSIIDKSKYFTINAHNNNIINLVNINSNLLIENCDKFKKSIHFLLKNNIANKSKIDRDFTLLNQEFEKFCHNNKQEDIYAMQKESIDVSKKNQNYKSINCNKTKDFTTNQEAINSIPDNKETENLNVDKILPVTKYKSNDLANDINKEQILKRKYSQSKTNRIFIQSAKNNDFYDECFTIEVKNDIQKILRSKIVDSELIDQLYNQINILETNLLDSINIGNLNDIIAITDELTMKRNEVLEIEKNKNNLHDNYINQCSALYLDINKIHSKFYDCELSLDIYSEVCVSEIKRELKNLKYENGYNTSRNECNKDEKNNTIIQNDLDKYGNDANNCQNNDKSGELNDDIVFLNQKNEKVLDLQKIDKNKVLENAIRSIKQFFASSFPKNHLPNSFHNINPSTLENEIMSNNFDYIIITNNNDVINNLKSKKMYICGNNNNLIENELNSTEKGQTLKQNLDCSNEIDFIVKNIQYLKSINKNNHRRFIFTIETDVNHFLMKNAKIIYITEETDWMQICINTIKRLLEYSQKIDLSTNKFDLSISCKEINQITIDYEKQQCLDFNQFVVENTLNTEKTEDFTINKKNIDNVYVTKNTDNIGKIRNLDLDLKSITSLKYEIDNPQKKRISNNSKFISNIKHINRLIYDFIDLNIQNKGLIYSKIHLLLFYSYIKYILSFEFLFSKKYDLCTRDFLLLIPVDLDEMDFAVDCVFFEKFDYPDKSFIKKIYFYFKAFFHGNNSNIENIDYNYSLNSIERSTNIWRYRGNISYDKKNISYENDELNNLEHEKQNKNNEILGKKETCCLNNKKNEEVVQNPVDISKDKMDKNSIENGKFVDDLVTNSHDYESTKDNTISLKPTINDIKNAIKDFKIDDKTFLIKLICFYKKIDDFLYLNLKDKKRLPDKIRTIKISEYGNTYLLKNCTFSDNKVISSDLNNQIKLSFTKTEKKYENFVFVVDKENFYRLFCNCDYDWYKYIFFKVDTDQNHNI